MRKEACTILARVSGRKRARRLVVFFAGSLVYLVPVSTLAQTPPDSSTQAEIQPEPSTEDDFERIFGRPRSRDRAQQVIVPFFINEQEQGQIMVLLSPGGEPQVRFQATPFLEKTAEVLRPQLQEQLHSAVDEEGNLSLEVLVQKGLEATFDQRQLELQVEIPPGQRKTNVYQLRGSRLPTEAQNARSPSAVSGYVNLRGGQEIVWTAADNVDKGRQPLNLNLEAALNFQGWVLESQSTFTEGSDPALVRGDLRLVRDAPAQAVRYVVGDLSLPTTGYQNSRPMAGITVEKNFSLQPYMETRPINEFKFFLETSSTVEVYINGLLVETLQLPAGEQDIRDLPLNTGINNVTLVITDAVGRTETLNFPASVAADLLAPGIQQFAYSLGFPTTAQNDIRSYDWEQPTLTLSHRWGVTNTLTMGGYLQADWQQQLVGVEGVWATPYGNFGWDGSLSHDDKFGTDYAFKLRYEYLRLDRSNSSQPTFRFTLEHRGTNFITLGDLAPRNENAWNLSANYSQRLFWGMSGNLGANYQFGRAETLDTYGLSLGISKSFGSGLGANLNLSYRQDRTGADEQRAFLNLSWSLPQRHQSITASTEVKNTGGATNRTTWNYNSPKTIGGLDYSVGAVSSPNDQDLTARLDYTGYRANINLFHNVSLPRSSNSNLANEAVSNRTKLTFGTALVFADGYFGWSRPVDNSFALIVRHAKFKDQMVGINPSRNGYIARADFLGSAVVPSLSPYYLSKLQVEAPDLPLGYDLGAENYHLLPSYKSGTLIRVGTEATVFIRGILLDASGEPVSLQTGEVISLSDSNWQSATLFTNRVGKFALEGFKTGCYQLRLFNDPQAIIRFEIPSGEAGLYDLGELKINASNRSSCSN